MTHSNENGSLGRTVGHLLLAVVLLGVLAPFVAYAVPGVVGGEASYVVLTASMSPEIEPGDVVVVEAADPEAIAVGDVVTFEQRAGEIPVTHRVVDIERSPDGAVTFVTKGDANEDPDTSPVPADRVVGRVFLVIPVIGHVVEFVGTPLGFVALVVVPIGLLIVWEILDLLSPESGSTAETPDSIDVDDADEMLSDDSGGIASGDSEGTIAVTRADLTVSVAVLAVFGAYASVAAYQRPTGVSVAIAVAVVATFVVAAGFRQLAPDRPAVADGGSTMGVPGTAVATVRLNRSPRDGPRVDVATLADLTAVATVVGSPLLRDDEDQYVVLDGDVAYVYAESVAVEPAEERDWAERDWMLSWAADHVGDAVTPATQEER